MGAKFANNAVGTLAIAISDSDTLITVSGDEGQRFPTLLPGDYFYATLVDADGNREIVKVTARVGNTMTVERGQDGTTPRSFDTGSKVSHRLTAGMLNEFVAIHEQQAKDFTDFKTDVAGDLVTGGTASAYTLTTAQTFNSLVDGIFVTARMHVENAEDPTFRLNTLDPKPIRTVYGTNIPEGALAAGGVYSFVYNSTDDAWIVHGRFADTITKGEHPDLLAIEDLTGTGVLRRADTNQWALDAEIRHLAATEANKVFGSDKDGKSGFLGLKGFKVSDGVLQHDISELDVDNNPHSNNDYAIMHDQSAGEAKRVPLGLLPGAIIAIMEGQQPSGSGALGISNNGTRLLNTLTYNRDNLVSLNNNRFTLPAGTWEISWEAPCYAPNVTRNHQSYLYNVTDNAVVARGIGAQFDDGDGGDGSSTMSCGSAVVSISSSKTFEIRSNTSGSLWQGFPTSFGTQVLTRAVVRRA